jgi:flagellar hook-basal body complex protein FliE
MSLNLAMLASDIARTSGTSGIKSAVSVQAPEGAGADFAQTMASMTANAISNVKSGETTAMAGMQGKATLQQVVEAVMHAEQSLKTVVAVRDKVVGAYQEISRMQV